MAAEVALANHNYPTSSIFKCLCTDPSQANLDPNGPQYVSTPISGTTGALANGVIDPHEKEPLTDEFMVQSQRELMPSFAVRVTGVYSRNRNTYMLENLLRPPSTYTLAVTNPIPSAALGGWRTDFHKRRLRLYRDRGMVELRPAGSLSARRGPWKQDY
jgi:hypothetical protein